MVSSRRIPAIAILCIFIGERVDKEAINNDIESRACSQKSDVPHTNSSMHFENMKICVPEIIFPQKRIQNMSF